MQIADPVEHRKTAERRAPELSGGIRNLQVGCGPKHIREQWWNTDLRVFKGIDEQLDAAQPWRWHDLLDHVYAEHFLEHLDVECAMQFLINAGNALRVGGHLRLSTPALEWVWSTHLKLPAQNDDGLITDTLRSNRAFHGWGHRFLWSRPLLERLLSGAGYENVRFCDYGESDIREFRNLELHGGYSIHDGYPSVWIVEATRGPGPIRLDPKMQELFDHEFIRHVRSGH